jgi:beta-mannan synthase
MLFTYMSYSAYELYVALLDATISVAVALSVIVSLDRLFHVLKFAQVRLRSRMTGRKAEEYYQFAPLPDPVVCGELYPKVCIQLPMFNERAVCQASIDSACEQNWPKSRLKVQVGAPLTGWLTRLTD